MQAEQLLSKVHKVERRRTAAIGFEQEAKKCRKASAYDACGDP